MLVGALGNRSYLVGKAVEGIPGVTVEYLKKQKEFSERFDVILCVGYYRIIRKKNFDKPKHGTFVLHGSDLPLGRGWAPINWALANQDSHLYVTSFQVDEGCDTGLYFMKTKRPLEDIDTLGSAFVKVEEMCVEHLRGIVVALASGEKMALHEQVGEPTWNERRRPEDSELDLKKPLKELWPLIRACNNDDYPAFFKLDGKRVNLRYEVVDE